MLSPVGFFRLQCVGIDPPEFAFLLKAPIRIRQEVGSTLLKINGWKYMEHNDIINMSNHGGLGSDHVAFYLNGCFLGEPAVNVFQGDIPPGCPFVVESVKLFSSWNDWNPGWGKNESQEISFFHLGKLT